MSQNQKIVFAVILLAATGLIFFRLGRADPLADDAHYAMRALGYFDYMASQQQTTPVQWFGQRPVWSYLSFHDHPPLYFFVQHIFFKFFGSSIVVSRLTSALAAAGSLVLFFFIARLLGGPRLGLLAMGALVLNNYFIWQGRIGLLESFFIFWVLLGLLFLLKAIQVKHKFFMHSGLFFGLALLTKYTFLFIAPAIVLFALVYDRTVLKSKHLWLGVLVFFLVISPLIVYNMNMLQDRGHFDVQLSDLFGQQHDDWPVLRSRVGGLHFNFRDTASYLISGMSWPYFLLVLAALLFTIFLIFHEKQKILTLPLLVLFFLFVFLAYVGGADRWLGVMAPFASLFVAVLLNRFWQYHSVRAVSALLGIYFLIFLINSNHVSAASSNKYLTSTLRKENLGFNQLDEKLSIFLYNKRPRPAAVDIATRLWFSEIKPEAIDFPTIDKSEGEEGPIIVTDPNISWFPVAWLFERRKFYERYLIASADEFAAIASSADTQPSFSRLQGSELLFIKASTTTVAKPDLVVPETEMVLDLFKKSNIQPQIIFDDKGREAFYIYEGVINQ